jgi:hypothetical protein
VLLEGIVTGLLHRDIEGVAAVFLSRHYLELAIKYALFHSRWLTDEMHNAADDEVDHVAKSHNLEGLWRTLAAELNKRVPNLPGTLDLEFVAEFVKEFHVIDPNNDRFRYPGDRLEVGIQTAPAERHRLGIDFSTLLSNLDRVHDVLGTLDTLLVEQYGQNEEWERTIW